MVVTFFITLIAWVFFRAENMGHAFSYIGKIYSSSFFKMPGVIEGGKVINIVPDQFILSLLLFLLIEWIGRNQQYAIANLGQKWRNELRWTFYALLVFSIFYLGNFNENAFIYFQF